MQLRFHLAYVPTPHLGLDERLALLDVLLEPEVGQRGVEWGGKAMVIGRSNEPRSPSRWDDGWPSERGGRSTRRNRLKGPKGTRKNRQEPLLACNRDQAEIPRKPG